MIESNRPVAASFFAAIGISNEPGTRTISICFSAAPARVEGIERAREQPVRDEIIELAYDDAEAQARRIQIAAQFVAALPASFRESPSPRELREALARCHRAGAPRRVLLRRD